MIKMIVIWREKKGGKEHNDILVLSVPVNDIISYVRMDHVDMLSSLLFALPAVFMVLFVFMFSPNSIRRSIADV